MNLVSKMIPAKGSDNSSVVANGGRLTTCEVLDTHEEAFPEPKKARLFAQQSADRQD